jgi:hypothetical protein
LEGRVGESFSIRSVAEPADEGETWELVELSELRSQGEFGGAECWEFNALFRAPEPRPDGSYVMVFAGEDTSPPLYFNPVISRHGQGLMQLAVSSSDPTLVGTAEGAS